MKVSVTVVADSILFSYYCQGNIINKAGHFRQTIYMKCQAWFSWGNIF